MLNVPLEIRSEFDNILKTGPVPVTYHNYYHKWLRYYLDFCHKYRHPENDEASRSLFIGKLREKKQPIMFQKQASHAISLYYQLIRDNKSDQPAVGSNDARERTDKCVPWQAYEHREMASQPAEVCEHTESHGNPARSHRENTDIFMILLK
ncbi:MAG: hypothetical protein B6245_15760 [Desulfobacteraceae bacterium 4572_88]|nr:MAG: hypothetical protein B6245_15760 [Desulfobacteraceae bacterium 4572_88]